MRNQLKQNYQNYKQIKTYLFLKFRQIEKDLERTHPLIEYFKKNGQGYKSLNRLLTGIANYDLQVGYVQGMNFIIAGLLYQNEEYLAFWNYVLAYEILELRDIYIANFIELPGLSKHNQMGELLLMSQMNSLHQHFLKNQVYLSLFCTPLLLSLLAMTIPVEDYINFFIKLVENGWSYFYKVFLSYFKYKKDYLMSLEGPELLYEITSSIQRLQGKKDKFYDEWTQIIKQADDIQIDRSFVKNMLNSYDQDKQIFLLKK